VVKEAPVAIDVHAHCVPEGLVPALAGGRFGVAVPELEPLLSDLPARIAAMDRMGVDRQVVSPFIDLIGHGLDAATGRRYCALLNDLMAATVALAPDRLSGLGAVPLGSGRAAAEELVRAVTRLGLAGVEIGTDTGPGHLDDADLEPFWETAAGLRCLVFIHPNAAARMRSPCLLSNFVGNPADTTMAAARMMFGGVLDRHPNLRICLAHGGGFLPYQAGRLDRGFTVYAERFGARLTSSPLELLGRFCYDTVLHSTGMLGRLVELVGPERVLLGTDYPFEMGDPDPMVTLGAIPGLGNRDLELIRDRNARRLLTIGSH